MEDSLDPEIPLCRRCGAAVIPGRTSCHMCYAPIFPISLPSVEQIAINLNIVHTDDSYETTDVDEVPMSQNSAAPQYSEQIVVEAAGSPEDESSSTPPLIQPKYQPVSLQLPDFLNPRIIRKYARRYRMSRWFVFMRRIVIVLLIASVISIPYAMYRRYLQSIPNPVQQTHQSAKQYATAINQRDYQWLFDHTLWRAHFGRLMTNASDIKHLCHHPDRFNSQKLRYLAEIWQMKHTVVSDGTQIGRNSIACRFTESNAKRHVYTLTFTKSTNGQWMWDICYDIRLTPNDIPLLNNIIAKSRLQSNR